MTTLAELSVSARDKLQIEVTAAYEAFKARGLKLDMTRGKPAPDQLDLANAMLTLPGNGDYFAKTGRTLAITAGCRA